MSECNCLLVFLVHLVLGNVNFWADSWKWPGRLFLLQESNELGLTGERMGNRFSVLLQFEGEAKKVFHRDILLREREEGKCWFIQKGLFLWESHIHVGVWVCLSVCFNLELLNQTELKLFYLLTCWRVGLLFSLPWQSFENVSDWMSVWSSNPII